MRSLPRLLPLLLPLAALAQSAAPVNKQLFDRTIDELNFRTFETVYDKHYTRQKYPVGLRTAAARRTFAEFEGNAELQKLFANYNGVAERYKARFGSGPLTSHEFDKQLSGVLRDRNFEFFIRGLPLDERRALIRQEERVIKQATAQFDASASPTPPAPPQPEEPLAAATPLTTHGPDPQETSRPATPAEAPATDAAGPTLRAPAATEAEAANSGPGWVGYFTLLLSLGSFGLLLYTVASLLPELHRLRRRVRALEATPATFHDGDEDAAPDADDPDAPARPGLLSRLRSLRPQRTTELPADQYGDEDDDEPGPEDDYQRPR